MVEINRKQRSSGDGEKESRYLDKCKSGAESFINNRDRAEFASDQYLIRSVTGQPIISAQQ
jgi:hypothetical protein